MDWGSKLDDFGKQLLNAIGTDPDWLPIDHNPISEELKRNPQLISDLIIDDFIDEEIQW